jgi:hypothetical protein
MGWKIWLFVINIKSAHSKFTEAAFNYKEGSIYYRISIDQSIVPRILIPQVQTTVPLQ